MSLSKRAARIVDEFDRAARHWGWTQDQGSGASVPRAEAEYKAARSSMERLILRLERRTA